MTTGVNNTMFWYFKSEDPWPQKLNDKWVKYRNIEMRTIELI